MKKKRFLLISILVPVAILVFFLAKPSNEQVYAKEFLNDFYNISDYELCTYLTDAALTRSSENFTDEGYNQYISNEIYAFYEEYAYENKCSFSVNSMKVSQTSYDATAGIWKFSFEAELKITYQENEQIHYITQTGTITILSQNDTMKIDSINIDNMNDLF